MRKKQVKPRKVRKTRTRENLLSKALTKLGYAPVDVGSALILKNTSVGEIAILKDNVDSFKASPHSVRITYKDDGASQDFLQAEETGANGNPMREPVRVSASA